jgi:hypothetical protein
MYGTHSHLLTSPPRHVTPQQVAANAGIHAIDFRAGSVAWACDPKTHSPQVGTKPKPTSHSFSRLLLCLPLCRRGVWPATSTSLSISAALATTECCDCGTGAHRTRCRRTWLMTAGAPACLLKPWGVYCILPSFFFSSVTFCLPGASDSPSILFTISSRCITHASSPFAPVFFDCLSHPLLLTTHAI